MSDKESTPATVPEIGFGNIKPKEGWRLIEVNEHFDAMMNARGYLSPHRKTPRVMGILAVPLTKGAIRLNQHVNPV